MKTAEEWALDNGAYKPESHSNVEGYCEFGAESFVELVKQIQLDALKAGMTRAASLCEKGSKSYHKHAESSSNEDKLMYKDREIALLDIELEILASRDNLK